MASGGPPPLPSEPGGHQYTLLVADLPTLGYGNKANKAGRSGARPALRSMKTKGRRGGDGSCRRRRLLRRLLLRRGCGSSSHRRRRGGGSSRNRRRRRRGSSRSDAISAEQRPRFVGGYRRGRRRLRGRRARRHRRAVGSATLPVDGSGSAALLCCGLL